MVINIFNLYKFSRPTRQRWAIWWSGSENRKQWWNYPVAGRSPHRTGVVPGLSAEEAQGAAGRRRRRRRRRRRDVWWFWLKLGLIGLGLYVTTMEIWVGTIFLELLTQFFLPDFAHHGAGAFFGTAGPFHHQPTNFWSKFWKFVFWVCFTTSDSFGLDSSGFLPGLRPFFLIFDKFFYFDLLFLLG